MSFITNIYNYVLKILSTCLVCRSNNGVICENCEQQFKIIYNNTPQMFNNYPLFVPYKYDNPIIGLILKFKYNNKHHLADYFAKQIHEICNIPGDDVVYVPIPISKYKLIKRGYNQTVLLANSMKDYGIQYKNHRNITIGSRVLKTSNKYHNFNADVDQRKQKASMIELDDITSIINKSIIIIDDVMASGSTIERVIHLLEPYVKNISIVVIAKT
jgi:ComF family protein